MPASATFALPQNVNGEPHLFQPVPCNPSHWHSKVRSTSTHSELQKSGDRTNTTNSHLSSAYSRAFTQFCPHPIDSMSKKHETPSRVSRHVQPANADQGHHRSLLGNRALRVNQMQRCAQVRARRREEAIGSLQMAAPFQLNAS
jgi:hypothetical protein